MSFQRLPVIWNDSMETHARMYLAAEALGLLPTVNKSSWEIIPTIHNDFFDALHLDNQALLSDTDLLPLFESRGVSRESLERAWNSPAVLTRLQELKSMQAFSEVPALPALVVHGRYIVTLNEAVTSVEHLIKVMNFLVGKVREEGSPRE